MILVLAILTLSFAFLAFVCFWASQSMFKLSKYKTEGIDPDFILGLVFSYAGVCVCALTIYCGYYMINGIDESIKYPAKEYRIETEITTRGDVSDTTYVIIKK